MALRKIVEQGDECLERVCRPVTEFNGHLHILLDDLAETLRDANGAGLAAPQVGVLRRVCVVLDEDTDEIIELINPKIVASSGQQTGLEGCLSIPGKYGHRHPPGSRPGPGAGPQRRPLRGGGRGPDGPGLLP
jgi:peptide deformylase